MSRHLRRMLCQAANTAWSGSTKNQDSGLTDQQLVRVVLFDAMKLVGPDWSGSNSWSCAVTLNPKWV